MENVIAGVVVAIIIGIFFIIAKKDGEALEKMVSNITEEQKNKLALTDIQFIDNKNEWIQQGMVYEIKDKGNKVALKVLWHNKVMQNNGYDKLTYADVTIKKSEQEEHNLKVGDFVKMHIAPEKTVGTVKILWD